MKVIHIAERPIGGVASHLEEILPRQIERLGKGNVTLLAREDARQHIPHFDGLNLETFGWSRSRLHSTWTLARTLRRLIPHYGADVIHAHSSFAGFAARLLGGARSLPVIYCPHGWAFTQDLPMWKRRIYVLLERIQLPQSSFVVNVSDYEKALAVDFGLPAEKLVVVYNGIMGDYSIPKLSFPAIAPDRLNLGFVGRAERAKGFDILVAAARELLDENILFHVVGPSPGEDGVLADDMPPNLILYGWQSRNFALSLMDQVDAVVLPSRWEGLPMTGIEAMRASKAIIASNRCALPELVEDGVSGRLVDIGQPGALSSVLRSLSREDLQQMGRAGRRKFEQRYVVEKQVEDFLALYEESIRT